jgi:hypothetical protein
MGPCGGGESTDGFRSVEWGPELKNGFKDVVLAKKTLRTRFFIFLKYCFYRTKFSDFDFLRCHQIWVAAYMLPFILFYKESSIERECAKEILCFPAKIKYSLRPLFLQ